MDQNPKISVITVTARHGGIDVNWSSLRRQTFKDFEWILCDSLWHERRDIVKEYTKEDSRVVHFQQHPKEHKAKTWLNHAENQAIKKARGELVVMLQDYIHIKPDALEKFWVQYQTNKKSMITGVGHQYGFPGKQQVIDKTGLITIFNKPFEQEPTVIAWTDPRVRQDMGSFYKCQPVDIEFNFCALPYQALVDVGGCDEEYDFVGHAYDNCSVAQRAFALGYESYIDQSNISYSIKHDDFFDAQVKENDWKEIADFHVARMKEIQEGKRPIKYPYLD